MNSMNSTIRILSEDAVLLVAVCAGLSRECIRYNARHDGTEWVIEITGF